mmetsp:Transcript_19333/g.28591  ORF Transcript_19333/g.28591 Transcript_19333/m.28591 type:complete len:103 (-) Transcript_19333:232-540(-)
MSDSDEDIFAASSDSGGDTDELIAASKAKTPAIAKKKTNKEGASKSKANAKAGPKKLGAARLKKKQTIPDADNDSDDEAGGLFDSDDEAKGSAAADAAAALN